MKILYLENHEVFASQVTQSFLSSHEVTIVSDVHTALKCLETQYDIALSDYDLNDEKGTLFVSKAKSQFPLLPIIAVSARDEGNKALINAGADAICQKTDFDEIQSVIDKTIQKKPSV